MKTFNNAQVANLPMHLRQYIVDQNYEKYTPIDQAVWRYVMRQNYSYLKEVAYYPYIKGLEQAGLNIEHIPNLQSINDNLGAIGWGAVTVDGFIPPSAFMEYQKYRVLVIAADIRQLKHIEYTPAPDIIHESAGHAPIIADTDYNNYLSYFGSIGTKAMFSAKDFELYEAIRHLSILKETVGVDVVEIEHAELKLKEISENMGEPSEMALLSRLHWWTVEYGLIGTLEDPKIYGAGLLSSIGESCTCMQPEVKKLWYTIDTLKYSYDITKPQPQLFVTPTFQNLIDVLEEFADSMAFRRGGREGLQKAIDCKNVATVEYSSGLQVSGVFTAVEGDVEFVRSTGPTALAFADTELEGHSKEYHFHGFSSPVGRLEGSIKALENFAEDDLQRYEIVKGKEVSLRFESGIKLSGHLKKVMKRDGKLILLTFEDCTVTDAADNVVFQPEWGMYDMAVGEKIVSVYNGAADKSAYEEIQYVSDTKTERITYSEKTLNLHAIYQEVRAIRESQDGYEKLGRLFARLIEGYPEDWLAVLEVFELVKHRDGLLASQVLAHLDNLKKDNKKLIEDGLFVIDNPVRQWI